MTTLPETLSALLDGGMLADAGSAVSASVESSAVDAGPVSTEPPGPPPPYDDSSCATCHAAQVNKKEEHYILKAGRGCVECHLPGSEPDAPEGKCQSKISKAWKKSAKEPALCEKCHDKSGKAPPHPVIASVGCTACHDAHGSDFPNHLKNWPAVNLCYDCHSRKDTKKEVHGAVTKGECLGCHDPHAGKAAPLLKRPKEQLCNSCHKPATLFDKRVHHVPVGEGRCLDCHDAHQSNFPKHTVKEGKALCLKCHDVNARAGLDRPGPAQRIDMSKKDVHPILQSGTCQDCHEQTHSADNSRLLKKTPPELCYDCHSRKDAKKYTHGAVKVGDCPVCHDPHSSPEKNLLRQPTVQKLCFQCHADDITGRAFIHKPVQEGQCTKCHDPHGSKNPFDLKAGEGKQFCYSCHKPKDDVKFKHRALERYGCTACHDPHASSNRAQLIKPVNQLCQSCHTDKMDGSHVSTMVPGGHRISGIPDTHESSKEFSCVSCHNPHGSDSPKMLRFGDDPIETCDWCHGDRTGKHPELKDISRQYRLKGAGGDTKGAGGDTKGAGGDTKGAGGDTKGAGGDAAHSTSTTTPNKSVDVDGAGLPAPSTTRTSP